MRRLELSLILLEKFPLVSAFLLRHSIESFIIIRHILQYHLFYKKNELEQLVLTSSNSLAVAPALTTEE